MINFQYKAVPAPTHGSKTKGVKGTDARFALAVSDAINEMAADGWEYVRAETLPCDERKGLTGHITTFQNLLIFRRVQTVSAVVPASESRQHDISSPLPLGLAENTRATEAPILTVAADNDSATVPSLGAARRDTDT